MKLLIMQSSPVFLKFLITPISDKRYVFSYE